MKPITYEEWQAKYGHLENACDEILDDTCTYYDTGVVKNAENDFIIKLDQVEAAND